MDGDSVESVVGKRTPQKSEKRKLVIKKFFEILSMPLLEEYIAMASGLVTGVVILASVG